MLMLIREMLQSRGKTIPISPGKPSAVLPAIRDERHMTDLFAYWSRFLIHAGSFRQSRTA